MIKQIRLTIIAGKIKNLKIKFFIIIYLLFLKLKKFSFIYNAITMPKVTKNEKKLQVLDFIGYKPFLLNS